MVPLPMSGIFTPKEKLGHRDSDTQGGRYVRTEAEAGGCVFKPRTGTFSFWQLPEARRETGTDSPSGLPEGTKPPGTRVLDFWPLELGGSKFTLFQDSQFV